MKKATIAAALGLSIMLPLAAFAGQYTTSWGTISRLETHGNGVRVYGLNVSPNPAGCSKTDAAQVQLTLGTAKREGLGRALTAAFLAGRQVKVKLHSTECSADRPSIYGVWTK